MPVCCVVQCGARKDKNQPQLSLHRFPKNQILRKKWLEAVGEENINPRHKEWFLCSLHFEDNCFNRTLDVVRLQDNSVPTIFPVSKTKKATVSCETDKINKMVAPAVLPSLQSLHEKEPKVPSVLCGTGSIEKSDVPCTSAAATSVLPLPLPQSHQSVHEKLAQEDKIKNLKDKFDRQRKKIKRLNEKIRRRNKKIANFKFCNCISLNS